MFWNVTLTLLSGLGTTIQIFFLTLLFALPLGLVIAFGSMSRLTPLRWLCNTLVWIVRGTPLMLQLIGFMYIPGILGNNIWDGEAGRMTATVVAFSINYACYFSVIYRGGIQGVPAGQREAAEAKAKDGSVYDEINRQIAQVPPGANGVLFLPYLMGERSPWWDAQAKGAFLGLGPESTQSEILRAVMEGVCMNLGLILEVFREKRDFTALRIIGGGAKEPVWRQMLADVLRVRVEKLSLLEEGCSLGAAIVAGIGAGVFSDSTAIDKFLHVDGVSEPDAERTEQYARLLPRFQDAYERLKGFYG